MSSLRKLRISCEALSDNPVSRDLGKTDCYRELSWLSIYEMKLYALIAAFLFLAVTSAQQQPVKQPKVNPFNVPDEIRACLRTKPEIEFNSGINPFYISGDFDGDGLTDFAVQVKSKNNQREGILFCFAKGVTVLLGAGAPIVWPQEDPKIWPFDSWMLIRKGSKHLSIYPQMKFDAIALVKADEGGGLLFWDGRTFRWKSEE